MFSREIQRQLEVYFSAIGSNSERTIKMTKGLIILIQIILTSLGTIKGLWDNGFNASVEAVSDSSVMEPASGYSKRWWKAAQAIFSIFAVTMRPPIGTFPSLVILDAEGNIVLGADGLPVRPYALFDPVATGPYALKTVEQFAWAEPEAGLVSVPIEIPLDPESELIP